MKTGGPVRLLRWAELADYKVRLKLPPLFCWSTHARRASNSAAAAVQPVSLAAVRTETLRQLEIIFRLKITIFIEKIFPSFFLFLTVVIVRHFYNFIFLFVIFWTIQYTYQKALLWNTMSLPTVLSNAVPWNPLAFTNSLMILKEHLVYVKHRQYTVLHVVFVHFCRARVCCPLLYFLLSSIYYFWGMFWFELRALS